MWYVSKLCLFSDICMYICIDMYRFIYILFTFIFGNGCSLPTAAAQHGGGEVLALGAMLLGWWWFSVWAGRPCVMIDVIGIEFTSPYEDSQMLTK